MRRLRAVPVREWPEVIAACFVGVGVELGIRLLPLPHVARMAGVHLDTREYEPVGEAERLRLADRTRRQLRATRRVMRHWPFGNTCLRHTLVLGQRLRHLKPVLRVGVAKVDGQVRAHAWLEIDGTYLDPVGGAESYWQLQPARGRAVE
jgi:hypothetical protein